MAAYRYASRITPVAWDPREVVKRTGPIYDWLKDCDREQFRLRCMALEAQTSNLGLEPLVRNPGQLKENPLAPGREAPELPHPGVLVRQAERIAQYLSDGR